jgi:hypothetical protein
MRSGLIKGLVAGTADDRTDARGGGDISEEQGVAGMLGVPNRIRQISHAGEGGVRDFISVRRSRAARDSDDVTHSSRSRVFESTTGPQLSAITV